MIIIESNILVVEYIKWRLHSKCPFKQLKKQIARRMAFWIK